MRHLCSIAGLVYLVCYSGSAQTGRPATTTPQSRPQQPVELSFALAAGQQYEQLGEWEKAEEQFLKAANDPTPGARQTALTAIVRVRRSLRDQRRHSALAAARLLEDQERWKEAEQTYLDLLKSDPGATMEVGDALSRLRPRLNGKRWAEAFDETAANTGRVLLVLSVVLVLSVAGYAISKARRCIQFLPFRGSSDTGAKQIAFWLGRVRAELRAPAAPSFLSPSLVSGLPFIRMPDLPEQLSESPELEVGGIKLPLKQLTQIVGVPRVRVSGGWMVGSITGDAYAEIERRRGAEFEPHSVITRAIASSPGDVQDRDLRLFAYDVLIKAGGAYGR